MSHMAERLIGSEIIKLAGEIRSLQSKGENIYNFTIGDFDPMLFPIPDELKRMIGDALNSGETNYPPSSGLPNLRKSLTAFLSRTHGLEVEEKNVLVAGGARPLIYAVYQTILDPGDKVVYPVPSWNNNHYTHLASAEGIPVVTTAEDHFMPLAENLAPLLKEASLLSLCSPLNPTGTAFTHQQLEDICDLVLEINRKRSKEQKPLYILYDQIYSQLCYGETTHVHPVQLRPELKEYTIYIDGISKAFASTGLRVGWASGPEDIISKMGNILGHIGAWAPRAEQYATGRYLNMEDAVDRYLGSIKSGLFQRLDHIYDGIMKLREKGYPLDAIKPQAALYLSVKINLFGYSTPGGGKFETSQDITRFLLQEAKLAIVPFAAFGMKGNKNPWYRLSVGTCRTEDIPGLFDNLEAALAQLKSN